MRTYLLILVALFCCTYSDATEITWLKTDWPPHQITVGVHTEQGTFDKLQRQVIAKLPQLTHQVQVVNLPRIEQAFQQTRKSVCSFGSIFTEKRAKTRWYSKAVAVLPGLAVHFRSSAQMKNHPALLANGAVDVRVLSTDNSLTGAYQPNRFYPPSVIDATLSANFIPHEFTSQVNAAALLLSKRVDYVIEYPERMAFYLQQNNKEKHIVSAAVADASPYVVSYITCNKGPKSQQVIAQINAALVDLWQTPDYKQAMFSWIDDEHKGILQPKFAEIQRLVIVTP